MNNKTVLWFLLAPCLCLLPACEPKMPSASQPVAVADTPKALLARLHAANRSWDYASLLNCMAPADRHEFQFVLDESRRYTDRVQAVQDLIRQKIGSGQARKFRDVIFPGIFASPFGQAGEKEHLDFGKVHVNVSGDMATVRTDAPYSLDFNLRRADGQWYLASDYYLRRAGKDGLTWYTREFARHIQTLDAIEADVDSGVLNKGNFDKHFAKPKEPKKPKP